MMKDEKEADLLHQARQSWEDDYTKAHRELFAARLELQRLDLKIRAYENKLAARIDPVSEEWAETWEELREIKVQRDAYLYGEYASTERREREAHARTSAYRYPNTEETYFREWLAR